MDIRKFITWINKRNGWTLDARYYSYITDWRNWWEGNYPSFHNVRETGLDGKVHTRPMYRLRMAKRITEDWAALLLNDKTTLTVGDEASRLWLLGDGDDQTGGLLGGLDFWPNANRLCELAFRSGTGAFLLSVSGARMYENQFVPSPDARLHLDYLPAECVLPITIQHGRVTEAAFASEVIAGGKSCIYLQTHRLVNRAEGGRQYRITNEYFTSESEESEEASYRPADLPEGMSPGFDTGSDLPWFALFSPAQVKNLPGGNGLGLAVFAEALDQIKFCDLAFDNYCRDVYLGGKKVFYSKSLLKPVIGVDGKARYLPPDDVRQQLFWQGEDNDPDSKPLWHEYNPDLRTESNHQAVQDALDFLSFKCGLGTRRYQFQSGGVVTATQYNGDRQDMVQHANRHQTQIESALLQILRVLLWAGKTIQGAPVDPSTPLSINWDDSYIASTEERRQQDKDDALNGFIPKWQYNVRYHGMSEVEAKAAVAAAQEESGAAEPLAFGA